MGILPLQFGDGASPGSLRLSGRETYDIQGLAPGAQEVTVVATPAQGKPVRFQARVRIDTPKEWEYYRNGGILPYVLRQLAA